MASYSSSQRRNAKLTGGRAQSSCRGCSRLVKRNKQYCPRCEVNPIKTSKLYLQPKEKRGK